MLPPELKQVAAGLGIKATGMKKAELVAAVRAAQGGQGNGRASGSRGETARSDDGGSRRSTSGQAAEQTSGQTSGQTHAQGREGRQRDGDAAPREQERANRDQGNRDQR